MVLLFFIMITHTDLSSNSLFLSLSISQLIPFFLSSHFLCHTKNTFCPKLSPTVDTSSLNNWFILAPLGFFYPLHLYSLACGPLCPPVSKCRFLNACAEFVKEIFLGNRAASRLFFSEILQSFRFWFSFVYLFQSSSMQCRS